MDNSNIDKVLVDLQVCVGRIEAEIVKLKAQASGPVSNALERTREGASLLRGLLWSARVIAQNESAQVKE